MPLLQTLAQLPRKLLQFRLRIVVAHCDCMIAESHRRDKTQQNKFPLKVSGTFSQLRKKRFLTPLAIK
jgi:hypothetical protein